MNLEGYLDRLSQSLREFKGLLGKLDFAPKLHSPATAHLITDFERECSVTLPSDVHALYKWSNGSSGVSIIPDFDFLSLQSVKCELMNRRDWMERQVVPLFTNGGGDALYVKAQGEPGLIFVWRVYNPLWFTPHYDSLLSLLETVIEGYTRGLIEVKETEAQVRQPDGTSKPYTRFATVVKSERKWFDLVEMFNPKSAMLWKQIQGDIQ